MIPVAIALLVGATYSFPNWWWYLTSPEYSVVRGYILSDDDIVPYAIGLQDASDGWPPTSAFLRSFETRDQLFMLSVSYWITNLLLGNLLRALRSLELLVPVGLLFSGTVVFLLFYTLAHRLIDRRSVAVLISLVACFRYPFYVTWVAAARRFIENGWHLELSNLLRLSFPGMVNAFQLYPYLRWPVTGMVYWWFLAELCLILWLARCSQDETITRAQLLGTVCVGALAGLSAFVYFYIWTYSLGLLLALAATGWFLHHRRLAVTLMIAFAISLLFAAPQLLVVGQKVSQPEAFQTAITNQDLSLSRVSFRNFLMLFSTHGVIAGAVVLVALATGPVRPIIAQRRISGEPFTTFGERTHRWDEVLPIEAVVLFSLHITVVLLSTVELLGVYLWACHWAIYLMDGVAPVTVGWMIYRRYRSQANVPLPSARQVSSMVAGIGLMLLVAALAWRFSDVSLEGALQMAAALLVVLPAVGLAAWSGSRSVFISIAALVLLGGTWYLYHRVQNEMSWVALVPLGLWLVTRKPNWTLASGATFAGLNLLLAVGLQGFVRPVFGRAFFSQPREYTEALEWLDKNALPDSVVVTNGWSSDYLIRAYTHSLTLSVPDWWTPVDEAEQQERYLLRSAIYQMSPEFFDRMIIQKPDMVKTVKARVNWEWVGGPELDMLAEQHAAVPYDAEQYASLVALPLGQLLSVYRVDYIWVGPWERYAGQRDFASAPEVALVFANSLIQIYQVLK